MRISGGNKYRHWHKWLPNDKDIGTIKICSECGVRKFWDGQKWAYRKPRPLAKAS